MFIMTIFLCYFYECCADAWEYTIQRWTPEYFEAVRSITIERLFKKYCTTNRKVAGSIPDGVTGIFQSLNPFGRIVALESTQTLTEMSTMNPSWG